MAQPDKTDIQFKMSYLTWRLIYKPEVLIYSFLPVISGILYTWVRLGYIALPKTVLFLLYIVLLTLFTFTIHELYFINIYNQKLKQPGPDEKAAKNTPPQAQPEEDTKIRYVKGRLYLAGFILLVLLVISGKYFIAIDNSYIAKTVMTISCLITTVPLYIYRKKNTVNEICTLLFWGCTGSFWGVYFSTAGSIYQDLYNLYLPVFFSLGIYIILRYYVLNNNVYLPLTPDSIPEGINEKEKAVKAPEQVSSFFRIDTTGYYLLVLVFILLLYYNLIANLLMSPLIVLTGMITLIWGINIVKQIIMKDYVSHEHLAYMYRSSKIIYIGLNVAIVIGILAEIFIKYRLFASFL